MVPRTRRAKALTAGTAMLLVLVAAGLTAWLTIGPSSSQTSGGAASTNSGPQPFAILTGHDSDVIGVAFSPDGKNLGTGSTGGAAPQVWDIATSNTTATLTHTGGSPGTYTSGGAAFTLD